MRHMEVPTPCEAKGSLLTASVYLVRTGLPNNVRN